MKIGYFANLNNLGHQRPYARVLDNAREIATTLDAAGWDSIWFTEHHFGIEGNEVLPNPIVMATDIAARTSNIRIGLAAAIIPFWHPLRLAEDIALLDQLSGGRLELGVGRGNYGLEGMNLNRIADPRNPDQNFAVFEETLDILLKAFAQPRIAHQGRFYSFPTPGFTWDRAHTVRSPEYVDKETNELIRMSVVPRTLQQPHPPLWQVIDSPRSIVWAARKGLKIIAWRPPLESLRERYRLFQREVTEARGVEVPWGEGTGLMRDMFVAETMEEARRQAGEAIIGYYRWTGWRGLGIFLNPGEVAPPPTAMSYDWAHPRSLLFGTPDYVAARIAELEDELNLEHLLVCCSWPGLEPEKTMRSLRLFNAEVLPRLRGGTRPGAARAEGGTVA